MYIFIVTFTLGDIKLKFITVHCKVYCYFLRFKKYKCLNMRDIIITILVLVIGLMMLHVKSI